MTANMDAHITSPELKQPRQRAKRIFAVVAGALFLLGSVGLYLLGYQAGQISAGDRAECRTELNASAVDAERRVSSAAGRGLAATVARGDPVLTEQLLDRLGEPPEKALARQFDTILDASTALDQANEMIRKKGGLVVACEDGEPFN